MKVLARILIILMLLPAGLIAQSGKVAKADKLFANLSYAEAIPIYEDLVSDGVKDDKILRNLATSYYNTRMLDKAENSYKMLCESEKATAEDVWGYAQTLKSTGNYTESSTWVQKFHDMQAADSRANEHIASGNYPEKFKANAERIKIASLGLNTINTEFGAARTGNAVVFASTRGRQVSTKRNHTWNNEPFLDLFIADVASDGELTNIHKIKGNVNTKYHEGVASFSPDGKMMAFTRNNYYENKVNKTSDGVNNLKIFIARPIGEGEWGNVLSFPHSSNEYSVAHPAFSADGNTLYFSSDMPGSYGGTDIYMSSYDSGTWSKPENLGSRINTEGDEMFPFSHVDGTLYFSSNGHVNLGGLDIFSSRMSAGSWSIVENIGFPINSKMDDFAFTLAEGGDKGYFSSNREGVGEDDIYRFTMEPKKRNTITGTIVNAEDSSPIAGATAILFDGKDNKLEEVKVGEDGTFEFELDPELCNYYIMVNNGSGWTKHTSKNTPCDPKPEVLAQGNIPLSKVIYGAIGTVTDKETNEKIKDFNVILMDGSGREIGSKLTAENGIVEFPLSENTDYKIRFEKDGYLAKNGQFTTTGMQPGIVNINKFVDLNFEKVEIGKAIEIENIFFDLNKDNIRPDAAIELDKIVKVMEENPSMIIELGSHTDSRGSDNYNLSLSDRRAKSSAAYIVSKGIASNRITGKGYGESQLKNRCSNSVKCSEEEHQENRRTEFKIVKF